MANPGCLHPAESAPRGVYELLAIDMATDKRVTLRTDPRCATNPMVGWRKLQRTLPKSVRWFGDFTRL